MAEAIARGIGGVDIEVFSAGLHAMGTVADGSIMALETLGYGTEDLSSKGLAEVDLDSMDLIVSLMGPEGLATLPRRLCAEKISWQIPDPYGEDDESYIRVARLLEKKITSMLAGQKSRELFSV